MNNTEKSWVAKRWEYTQQALAGARSRLRMVCLFAGMIEICNAVMYLYISDYSMAASSSLTLLLLLLLLWHESKLKQIQDLRHEQMNKELQNLPDRTHTLTGATAKNLSGRLN